MLSSAHRSNGEVNLDTQVDSESDRPGPGPPKTAPLPPPDSDVGYPWYVTPSLLASARSPAGTGRLGGSRRAAPGRALRVNFTGNLAS
jgi:hypothetical protein